MLLELPTDTWDAICFCETRAAAADLLLSGGHRLITHKGESYGGVAVLVHTKFADHIFDKRSFGDRVLAVRVRKNGTKLTKDKKWDTGRGHGMLGNLSANEDEKASRQRRGTV